MTIDEAKEFDQQIVFAARALNKAISTAANAGVIVDLQVLNVNQLSHHSTPFVDVGTRVRPADINLPA